MHNGQIRQIYTKCAAVIALLGVVALGTPASAKDLWAIFDPPASISTFPVFMNVNGLIAGNYSTSDNVSHGFLRTPDGSLTTFDEPDATSFTRIYGLNNAGEIAGSFFYASGGGGFLRTPDGTFTAISLQNICVHIRFRDQ